jgi:hypothetical protein
MRFTAFCAVLVLAACTSAGAPEPGDTGVPAGDTAAPAAADTVAPAGGVEDGVLRDGVRYTASTAVLESFPVQLHTTVTLVNTGRTTARLEFPSGCVALLRAYGSATATEPVWDQATVVMCTMALQLLDLAPGESRSYSMRTDAREVLGDSLPDGTYHLRARIAVNGAAVEVPAGAVELAIPR